MEFASVGTLLVAVGRPFARAGLNGGRRDEVSQLDSLGWRHQAELAAVPRHDTPSGSPVCFRAQIEGKSQV